MSKNLVIVESPAKAKTIEKYLGKDFQVLSSMGHIRDLPQKGGGLGIDVTNAFLPTYEVSPDKLKIVSQLKKAAKNKTVWLATDEDREGEAISWHLCAVLGLDPKTTNRITFHEITKPAIEAAVKKPRAVDLSLVDAQQARRILDRLVGYELSPVLWKKIQTGLSAGRVQSVAVRLIVEREREIESFESKANFRIIGIFITNDGQEVKAELPTRFATKQDVSDLFTKIGDGQFVVASISKRPSKKSPTAPFTTSTLQQAASSRLGYSVRQTMTIAQRLYEAGHISYMRTDSVNLSDTALSQIKKQVVSEFGDKYYQRRYFKTKSKSAQEAHEAIRPTNFSALKVSGDLRQQKLYQLIWARTMASQMAEAQIEKSEVALKHENVSQQFIAKGELVVFAGFLKAYQSSKQADANILPNLKQGQVLKYQEITATETFSKPPTRYSEATLVKKLESEGIGRPSTYAPTISTIQARGYVEKSDGAGKSRQINVVRLVGGKQSEALETETYETSRNHLIPTDTAMVVNDFLTKYFESVVDYNFTAKVERQFDEIAEGREKWQAMIADFYKPFHKLVLESEEVPREVANQSRKLGVDPTTQKPVIARLGRFGAMIQIGEAEDKEKPKFAPMPEGRKISEVTLEEALKMFELPRLVGKTKSGDEIIAQIGRFGPYLKAGKINISLANNDPFSISEDEANQLVEEHLKKLRERLIQNFTKDGIQVLNGRYGPYVTDGKNNATIPKNIDPKALKLKDCQEILEKKLAARKK